MSAALLVAVCSACCSAQNLMTTDIGATGLVANAGGTTACQGTPSGDCPAGAFCYAPGTSQASCVKQGSAVKPMATMFTVERAVPSNVLTVADATSTGGVSSSTNPMPIITMVSTKIGANAILGLSLAIAR